MNLLRHVPAHWVAKCDKCDRESHSDGNNRNEFITALVNAGWILGDPWPFGYDQYIHPDWRVFCSDCIYRRQNNLRWNRDAKGKYWNYDPVEPSLLDDADEPIQKHSETDCQATHDCQCRVSMPRPHPVGIEGCLFELKPIEAPSWKDRADSIYPCGCWRVRKNTTRTGQWLGKPCSVQRSFVELVGRPTQTYWYAGLVGSIGVLMVYQDGEVFFLADGPDERKKLFVKGSWPSYRILAAEHLDLNNWESLPWDALL